MLFWRRCANILRQLRDTRNHPGVAKFGIALEWGSRGRWFESSHSDQDQKPKGFWSFSISVQSVRDDPERGVVKGTGELTSFHPLMAEKSCQCTRPPVMPTINWFLKKCCHCETSAHTGRGNPPVEWNQVAITTKNRRSSHFLGAIRYISPLTGGLPHQESGLVRNDSSFFVRYKTVNNNLSVF